MEGIYLSLVVKWKDFPPDQLWLADISTTEHQLCRVVWVGATTANPLAQMPMCWPC